MLYPRHCIELNIGSLVLVMVFLHLVCDKNKCRNERRIWHTYVAGFKFFNFIFYDISKNCKFIKYTAAPCVKVPPTSPHRSMRVLQISCKGILYFFSWGMYKTYLWLCVYEIRIRKEAMFCCTFNYSYFLPFYSYRTWHLKAFVLCYKKHYYAHSRRCSTLLFV